jgi:hypothetical protein
MKTERDAFESWAQSNGLDCQLEAMTWEWRAWKARSALVFSLTDEQIDDLISVEWANRTGSTLYALRRIARAVLAAAHGKTGDPAAPIFREQSSGDAYADGYADGLKAGKNKP